MKNAKLIFANHETELSEGASIQGIGFKLFFRDEALVIQVNAGDITLEHVDGSEERLETDAIHALQVGDVWSQDKSFGRLDYKVISII